MELLLPDRFGYPETAFGYVRTIFDQVAGGTRPATISITPSARHVGVTRRDTFRPGFEDAVRAAEGMGYPVLVRTAGGGATAADEGTFGFSIMRPAYEAETRRGIKERYVEAAALVLGTFSRLGVAAEVGEVRDEFCPGDHSIRVGDGESGMKVVGIAQRITRRATSVGGIVLVGGEHELARVLGRVYSAMHLPFRPESVGSLHRAGYEGGTREAIEALATEAERVYGAVRVPVDENTVRLAISAGQHLSQSVQTSSLTPRR
jgi:octanoyl-[GcvH]:protein N-octanoyltransferase